MSHANQEILILCPNCLYCADVIAICVLDFLCMRKGLVIARVITGISLGHMKHALVGVLTIYPIQQPRVHSSYDLVHVKNELVGVV